jgi:hypothetical protein
LIEAQHAGSVRTQARVAKAPYIIMGFLIALVYLLSNFGEIV